MWNKIFSVSLWVMALFNLAIIIALLCGYTAFAHVARIIILAYCLVLLVASIIKAIRSGIELRRNRKVLQPIKDWKPQTINDISAKCATCPHRDSCFVHAYTNDDDDEEYE